MSNSGEAKVAELIDLDFFQDSTTQRLLGVITALGGEVYVLKAMVNRLTVALEQQGVVTGDILERCTFAHLRIYDSTPSQRFPLRESQYVTPT